MHNLPISVICIARCRAIKSSLYIMYFCIIACWIISQINHFPQEDYFHIQTVIWSPSQHSQQYFALYICNVEWTMLVKLQKNVAIMTGIIFYIFIYVKEHFYKRLPTYVTSSHIITISNALCLIRFLYTSFSIFFNMKTSTKKMKLNIKVLWLRYSIKI